MLETSIFRKSKLLRNPTFSHVLRDQTFGVNRSMVNCFEGSQHTFLFNIENTLCKRELKKSKLFLNSCNGHFVKGVKTFYTKLRWVPQNTLLAETLWVFILKEGGGREGSHN